MHDFSSEVMEAVNHMLVSFAKYLSLVLVSLFDFDSRKRWFGMRQQAGLLLSVAFVYWFRNEKSKTVNKRRQSKQFNNLISKGNVLLIPSVCSCLLLC